MIAAAHEPGSYEERDCVACLSGLLYDGRLGAWVGCGPCLGTGRAVAFVYPKTRRQRGCASCGGRFSGRDLVAVVEGHMVFFEGDDLYRPCARRRPASGAAAPGAHSGGYNCQGCSALRFTPAPRSVIEVTLVEPLRSVS